ncbi:MAG: hypothetical protein K2K84_06780, partial [Muribaculaceae bacterium]|nr:hypothetical protein [Muribaculaceae bacterium]
ESDLPWKNYDSLHNSLEVVTFNDTVYDVDLPSIELKIGTYHNYGDATTVGFKLIVRGDRIEFKDALFYKEDPDAEVKSPMRPKEPFHFEIDNSTESNRIDHVYIQLKFPFSAYFSVDDSLVLITDKGDYTLYMGEDRRAEAKYRPILNRLNDELSVKDNELVEAKSINHVFVTGLIAVITLSVLACSVIIYIARKKRVKQATEMNRLLCLISENEMDNRRLKVAVSDLMRKHFDTINRLCGDYFEMADTPALKKIIYNKVEAEINRLKEAKNIKALEQTINQYCDNVMVRIDEQLPELSEKERLLLIYLYSGMSARTICVLTDIQLKNFYMRRQRLKSKILASDAPDKEYFAEMM